MRVLHVGKFWPPYAGGIERALHGLCSAQAAAGVEVDVLAHMPPGRWRGCSFDDAQVHVHLAGCPWQLAYAPLSPAFVPTLRQILRERQPQLLHLHMPNPAAFWPLLVPAARRLPWVVHWHSDIPLREAPGAVRQMYRFYRPWERALLKRTQRIIATSPQYAQTSTPLTPWRDKLRVIPFGLPASPAPSPAAVREARARWPERGLRLLAVGRLSHYKGFDVLLRALARTSDINLVLIGSGECETALRELRHQLGLAQRVRLCGALDDAARDAAYAAAELFCLPSVARSEAFGIVLLEAMRARLPIIASRVPGSGMIHVLDDGAAGRMPPANDVEALAAALTALANNPQQRRALAATGHQRWQQHFSGDAATRAMIALYQSLLADTAATGADADHSSAR